MKIQINNLEFYSVQNGDSTNVCEEQSDPIKVIGKYSRNCMNGWLKVRKTGEGKSVGICCNRCNSSGLYFQNFKAFSYHLYIFFNISLFDLHYIFRNSIYHFILHILTSKVNFHYYTCEMVIHAMEIKCNDKTKYNEKNNIPPDLINQRDWS